MFLKQKNIPASSLAEVVIAISVIAICIGVASLVFVRSTQSTMNFQDVKRQTEAQSEIWKGLFLQSEEPEVPDELTLKAEDAPLDSIVEMTYYGDKEKLIWKQDWWREK